ncbi:MAG: osmotically inducible protein OsmC [Desulfuromonadales bacterium]|nr:osmotically inducible protein OsmC [Desulfuromonadales bacterium]NIR33888.1 osmotically inducible protein OsmC [Desulfuromonadales bacterium]NIS40039.1 osmotically inducible protein OsmC [Desulfuromonadales bacterium]
MEITFPGGVAVEASTGGFTIRTDQPPENGGEGSAPPPFDLYLASLGTCAGFFALRFCQQRELETEGLTLSMDWERDEKTRLPSRVAIRINLPERFPEKYKKAIIRATDQCAVKRSILDPPDFEVTAG